MQSLAIRRVISLQVPSRQSQNPTAPRSLPPASILNRGASSTPAIPELGSQGPRPPFKARCDILTGANVCETGYSLHGYGYFPHPSWRGHSSPCPSPSARSAPSSSRASLPTPPSPQPPPPPP